MELKALLFDLDGTLLDSVAAILKANRETFDLMGLDFSDQDARAAIGIPLSVQAKLFGGNRAEEFIEVYKTAYRKYKNLDTHLYPGTIEMLDSVRAKGLKTALVTSKAAGGTYRAINELGLKERLDAVVTEDDVKNPKPDAEPVLKALEQLEVTPNEAVFVGDSLYDVESSRKAGVKMIGVSWGARSAEELRSSGVEQVVDSWDDLLEWIEQR